MVLVIAEAGVNHNGDPAMALELVDAAAECGADIVKFQTFRADATVTRDAAKAEYQQARTGEGSQHEMLRRLELDETMHIRLKARCAERGIEFLSTPFDRGSLQLLVRLGIKRIKIPSGELTNAPFLLEIARTRLPVLLSTGMATLGEIEMALGVLAFGYCAPLDAAPSERAFAEAFATAAFRQSLSGMVSILHCTTEYPAPLADVNLRAMDTIARAFGLPIGYSDHTAGTAVAIAAVARGATVIEKHFTLDRDLPGPDHKASIEPHDFRAMVDDIRSVCAALGSPAKTPAPSEVANIAIARRSIVAERAIGRGEIVMAHDIAIKRPGVGMSPIRLWDVLGRRARRDIAAGTLLDWSMVE
jgi:N-acetylneuraminate synthase